MGKIVKIVGTLVLMVVKVIVTGIVTGVILVEVGITLYDNYESDWLWGLFAVGFLAPGVVVWYRHKRGTKKG